MPNNPPGGDLNADAAVEAKLDRTLPDANFNVVGFHDVIDFLRDVSGTNIVVDWMLLQAAGVDWRTPISLRLSGASFRTVLRKVLDQVAPVKDMIGYDVDNGIITISTTESLSHNTSARVYDIRDLLVDAPKFGLTPPQFIDDIKKLIIDTVAPDSWREAGGLVGSIGDLPGQLVVNQTRDNHRQIDRLLMDLRETRLRVPDHPPEAISKPEAAINAATKAPQNSQIAELPELKRTAFSARDETPTPDSLQAALVAMFWKPWWGKLILALASLLFLVLFVWQTLPDKMKETIIAYLWGAIGK